MTLHTLLNVFVKSHKSTKRPCLYVLYISNMNLVFIVFSHFGHAVLSPPTAHSSAQVTNFVWPIVPVWLQLAPLQV